MIERDPKDIDVALDALVDLLVEIALAEEEHATEPQLTPEEEAK